MPATTILSRSSSTNSIIDATLSKKTTALSIFQRRVEFKLSTKPDKKMDLLREKYRPINESVYQAPISGLNVLKSKYSEMITEQQHQQQKNEKPTLEERSGFRNPSMILFERERLSPIWQKIYKIGPGLQNLGNTCFLNSVLQCLTYTPALATYLLSKEHSITCKISGFCLLCQLRTHVMRCFNDDNSGEIGRSISPKHIVGRLKMIAKHMKIGRQEDAHEFMRYLLDTVQSALLAEYDKNLDARIKETTLVHQIFGGYLQSQVKCSRCHTESNTFDPMLDVSLDIKNADTVERAFANFTKTETLSKGNRYKCEKCKELVDAQKQMTIYRAPLVLTVQLKRFNYGGSMLFGGGKVSRHVAFSENLDIRPYMSRDQRNSVPSPYRLYAVLVHRGGSCHSGHYYCYVRCSNGAWYCMNDTSVHQVSLATVLGHEAYILFYTQESLTPVPGNVPPPAKRKAESIVLTEKKRIKLDDIGEAIERKEFEKQQQLRKYVQSDKNILLESHQDGGHKQKIGKRSMNNTADGKANGNGNNKTNGSSKSTEIIKLFDDKSPALSASTTLKTTETKSNDLARTTGDMVIKNGRISSGSSKKEISPNSTLPTPSPSPHVLSPRIDSKRSITPQPDFISRQTVATSHWDVEDISSNHRRSTSSPTIPVAHGGDSRRNLPKPDLKNLNSESAVVVNYNERNESKQTKLAALIEKDIRHGRSAEVRDSLLEITQPHMKVSQFNRVVEPWGVTPLSNAKEDLLKKDAGKKMRRPNPHDIEYDQGKKKKIKSKNKQKFGHKQNPFQKESDLYRLSETPSRPVPSKPVRM